MKSIRGLGKSLFPRTSISVERHQQGVAPRPSISITPADTIPPPIAAPGSVVGKVQLIERVLRRSGDTVWSLWKAKRKDGSLAAVYFLNPRIEEKEKQYFMEGAVRLANLPKTQGVIQVEAADRQYSVLVCDFYGIGGSVDLFALEWKLNRRIQFFLEICKAISELHKHGIVHGCLRPGNVLLDNNLKPVLSEIHLVHPGISLSGDLSNRFGYGAYCDPDIAKGQEPTVSSDIYSLGRYLLFLFTGDHPPVPGENRAINLKKIPISVQRVARKCVAEPAQRYHSVDEMIHELEPQQFARSIVPQALLSGARRIGNQAAVRKIRQSMLTLWPTKARHLWLAGVGLSFMIASCALTFFFGTTAQSRLVFQAGLVLGGLVASFQLPSAFAKPWITRATLGLVVTAAFVFFQPIQLVAEIAAPRWLRSNHMSVRNEAVKLMARSANRDFQRAQLHDAKLDKLDLAYSQFAYANLKHANLRNAILSEANVTGTQLEGAHLGGADLTGVNLSDSDGIESAICNKLTSFPDGWRCHNQHPAPDEEMAYR